MEWQREIERAKRQHIFLFRPFLPPGNGRGKEERSGSEARSSSFSSLPFYEFRGIPTNGGRSKEKRGKRKKTFFLSRSQPFFSFGSALVLASFLLPSLLPPASVWCLLLLFLAFCVFFSATVVAKRDNVGEISRKN